MARETPKPDLRDLLAEHGYTLAAAERAAGLAQGSLSRRLCGRRGFGLQLDATMRIAEATGTPLQAIADAFVVSLAKAEKKQQRRLSVDRATLAALEA